MRLHFKLAAMLPALAGMLLLVSCAKGPSSVSIVPSSLELDEGGSGSLTAEVLPDNAKYGKISWTSSDESVATVSGGSVHALKAGTATITAMTEGVSGTARVTVKSKSIPVSGVNLSDSSIELVEGDSKQLSATVSPDNATDKSVSWKSADPSIATVDNNGKVTAVATGETTINVTTTDGGRTASCTITVKPVEATALSIDPSTAEIVKGGSLELQVTFVPENTTDKELTWSSTNPSVASVSEDGVVNALNEGKTKIYATASNGVKNYCEVTVLRDESLKGISFGVSSMELKVGETRRIDVYFTPDYAANTHLSWESSANGVVTVKDGDVTGVSEGEAVITATSEEGGFTASCKVVVSNKNETGTYVLKKYADMARKENPNLIPESVSCHQLRHSRAMHLLQAGVNLVHIRDLLGHTSIVTTEIYARADSKQKREAIEKASENLTPSQTMGEWVDNHDLISWLKKLGNN